MTAWTKNLGKHFAPAALAAGLAWFCGCSSYGPHFDPYASANSNENLPKGKFTTVSMHESIPQQWLKPDQKPYRLGSGDQLAIEIVSMPDTQSTTFVTPDGKIYYQNLSGVRVRGLTLAELKAVLEKELAKWYHSPQVSVSLNAVKSSRVWIMGRVTNPGVYPLSRPTTVIEAVSLAGGVATASTPQSSTVGVGNSINSNTEELADLSRAFFIRDGKMVPIDFKALLQDGQMAYNIYLKDGDYVYLPGGAAKEIFVMGSVNIPRSIRYTGDMSLIAAIANAGGTTQYAHVQNVVVIRGSLTDPKVAVVPYKDVATGEVVNFALEPHDIVWVPRSPWERLDVLLRTALNSFVNTVAVNEGAKFAIPNARPVGTTISVGGVGNQ